MKRNWQKTVWKASWIMPQTIIPTGIAALICFWLYDSSWRQGNEMANLMFTLFRIFYGITIGGGSLIIIAEAVILLLGLTLLIRRCRTPRAEREKTTVHWRMILLSPVFAAGTLLAMLLVHVFSYGMKI